MSDLHFLWKLFLGYVFFSINFIFTFWILYFLVANLFITLILYVCACTGTHMSVAQHMWSQKTTCGSWFSPSTMWVLNSHCQAWLQAPLYPLGHLASWVPYLPFLCSVLHIREIGPLSMVLAVCLNVCEFNTYLLGALGSQWEHWIPWNWS